MTYSLGNISTTQFYDRAKGRMGALSSQADALQTAISTGKKLVAPSSDSAAYQRLRTMAKDAANDGAYASNLKLAASGLKQADTTLTAIGTQLQRASELAIQARNGTQNDQTRAAIADSLAGLANTRDARGQYVFGGVDGSAGATATGSGYTLATTTGAAIPIGEGQSVQTGESAERVFKAGASDVFQVLAALSTALKDPGSDDAAIGSAIADLSAAGTQVSTVQASLGARAARVELEQTRLADVGTDREEARSAIEDTDISTAVIELQKTMTILQATQASFSKLQGLSLFDYLR